MNAISKADYSKKLNISRAAVTQACKNPDSPLEADANGFIDLEAESTKEYEKNRGKRKHRKKPVDKKPVDKKPQSRKSIDNVPKLDDLNIDLDDDTADMIKNMGGTAIVKEVMAIRKMQVETELKKMKLATDRNELISKEDLGNFVFNKLDLLNRKLLNMPVQFVDNIIAMVQSEGKNSRGKIIEIIKNEISKGIKDTKEQVKRLLDD